MCAIGNSGEIGGGLIGKTIIVLSLSTLLFQGKNRGSISLGGGDRPVLRAGLRAACPRTVGP
jgi:hypothetical protein